MARFQETEQAASSLEQIITKLTTTVNELAASLVKLDSSTKATATSQNDLKTKTTANKTAIEQLDEVETQRLKLLDKLKTANSDNIQKNVELQVQLQKQNKINKELAREKLKLVGAYEKEAKKLNELRSKYKDAAVQYGVNSKQAEKLRVEVQKLDAKLKNIDSSVGQNQRSVGNYQKAWSGLVGTFAVVSGAIASARGLIKGIGNVIKSTQASGDAWDITLGGLKASYDAFNKSLASGDLKNVFTNMKEAFIAGKAYAASLDDIGDRERALNVIRAESELEMEKQTAIVKNVNKSNAERINAAKKIFDIEKGLLERDQSVKKQAFDAEVDRISALTKLSKSQVFNFIKNYDEEKGLRDTAVQLQQLEADAKQDFANQDLDNYAKSKAALVDFKGALTENELAYIEIYKGYSKTTDDELNKVVETYSKLTSAETDSIKGMQRIQVQYNTLIKSISNDGESVIEKTTKETTNTLLEEIQKRLDANLEADEQRKKASSDLADSLMEDEMKLNDESLDSLTKKIDAEFELKRAAALKEMELAQEVADKDEELRQQKLESAATSLEFLSNSSQELFGLQQSLADSEIANLEMQKEAEIAAAEKVGKDTSAIDAKYAKKEAMLRTEQAKKEKAQALFTIAINTAVAAIKQIAAVPLPIGAPLLALVIAMGAIQAAVVAAKPLPKYKNSTKGKVTYDHIGIIGDGGARELLTLPDGKAYLSPAKDTPVFLPRGSEVFSGADTKEILQNGGYEVNNGLVIKELQLTRKAIENQKGSATWTDKGLMYRGKINADRRIFVNKNMI